MLSPHAALRQRNLFVYAVDADRDRRARGVPEPDREPETTKPHGQTLNQRLQAGLGMPVHTRRDPHFGG